MRELNVDEKVKQEAYYREKRFYDEASALGNARREEIEEGRAEGRNRLANNLRNMGMTEEQIKLALGNN